MIIPNFFWNVIKAMFQTTNQLYNFQHFQTNPYEWNGCPGHGLLIQPKGNPRTVDRRNGHPILVYLKWHIGEGNLVVVGYILYYVFCKLILQVDHLSSMAKKELVWEPQQALLTMFAKRKPCGSSGIIDSFPQILAVLQQPMLAKLITGPSPSMDIA